MHIKCIFIRISLELEFESWSRKLEKIDVRLKYISHHRNMRKYYTLCCKKYTFLTSYSTNMPFLTLK